MRKPFAIVEPCFKSKKRFLLSYWVLIITVLFTNAAYAQVILSGTSYTETFDGLNSGLPTGWSTFTGATTATLGTSTTIVSTATSWASTSGNFRNVASADGLLATAVAATQNSSTDRALAVRQTGAFGDPGAAFAVKLSNTTGFQNFQLSAKLQSLDQASARTTTFMLQYGIGDSPTSFISVATQALGGSTFTNNTITYNFGSTLDNIAQPVWIRIVALTASTGGGSRTTAGIDDFSLTYSPSATGPAIGTSLTSLPNVTYIEGAGPSAPTTFTVTGSLLTPSTPLTVAPPANFELSIDGTTFTPASLSLSPAADGTVNQLIHSRLIAGLSAGTYSGAIAVSSTEVTGSKTVAVSGTVFSATIVKIHDIQGTGLSFNSAYNGTQSIEGIVTRTFSGTAMLSGFYVQEEDADADVNPLTSEGIFVYDPTGLFTGNEGDKVKITGTVAEYISGTSSSLTQLANLISVTNLGASTLPTPTPVSLPVASVSDLEAYESMLVTMSASTGNLAVTEYFQLGRYGQVVLAAAGASNVAGTDARLDQYTQYNTPSIAGYAAYLAEIAKRKIILDDGSGVQNPAQILFGRGGMPLSASNTLRGGDEVTSITTVLDERFEGYRLQANTGINFLPTNVRPITPPSVGGTLKVASANVLNFFVNLDTNAPGTDYRGANTPQEFTRQRTKIIKNLVGSGADVFGIMELQNNGTTPTTAIQDLVAGLNAEPGSSGTYAFVDPAATGSSISTDAITVGIIYKTDKVTPVGAPATLTTSAAFDAVSRRPLAQTFRQSSNNEVFTLVVNHFKSKGSSSGGAGDADINDGQGASNGTRTRQAQDLAAWLATKPTGTTDTDYLVVGDLNAYAKEDPLTTLATAGYSNLLPDSSYSYVFDGQVGSLDHALASVNLTTQVTGAKKWHINADEPVALDYNTENKTAGQVSSLYNADQFRSSDHDPILIGLNLVTPPDLTPILYASPSSVNGTTTITVIVDVVELNSVATNGVVTVKIPKDPAFTLSLNQMTTSVNGHTVQNSDWNLSGPSSGFYTLTSSQAMAAGSVLSFGLDGVLTPGGTTGTLTFSAIVVGSSGEVKTDNNIDADKIDYFQQ